MRNFISVTTIDELKNYFKGSNWKGSGWVGDSFSGSSGLMDITVEPKNIEYDLSIEALEDPTDSEKIISKTPIRDIVEFLGKGLPEHNFLEMASAALFADTLRKVARRLESGRVSCSSVSGTIRRLSLFPVKMADMSPGPLSGGFEEIKKEVQKKGWSSHPDMNKSGNPSLVINISDIYEAWISIHKILYIYKFSFRGHSDLDVNGITDDPIREYRKWYKQDSIQKAKDEEKMVRMKRREDETKRAQSSMENMR